MTTKSLKKCFSQILCTEDVAFADNAIKYQNNNSYLIQPTTSCVCGIQTH